MGEVLYSWIFGGLASIKKSQYIQELDLPHERLYAGGEKISCPRNREPQWAAHCAAGAAKLRLESLGEASLKNRSADDVEELPLACQDSEASETGDHEPHCCRQRHRLQIQ